MQGRAANSIINRKYMRPKTYHSSSISNGFCATEVEEHRSRAVCRHTIGPLSQGENFLGSAVEDRKTGEEHIGPCLIYAVSGYKQEIKPAITLLCLHEQQTSTCLRLFLYHAMRHAVEGKRKWNWR